MRELIERLGRATEPDRIIDLDIARAIGVELGPESECFEPYPCYTSSIDAAMTLVPEGWFLHAAFENTKAIIYRGDQHDFIDWNAALQHRYGGRIRYAGSKANLALALCIAALKARDSSFQN